MPRITVEGGGRAPMRDHGDGGFRGGDRGGGRNNNNNRNNKIMCEVDISLSYSLLQAFRF
jgi:hypothetical protein